LLLEEIRPGQSVRVNVSFTIATGSAPSLNSTGSNARLAASHRQAERGEEVGRIQHHSA
jgi:hypothetical protein